MSFSIGSYCHSVSLMWFRDFRSSAIRAVCISSLTRFSHFSMNTTKLNAWFFYGRKMRKTDAGSMASEKLSLPKRNDWIYKIPEFFCHPVDMKRWHPFPNQTWVWVPLFTSFYLVSPFCSIKIPDDDVQSSKWNFLKFLLSTNRFCCDRCGNSLCQIKQKFMPIAAPIFVRTRAEVAIVRLHRIGTRACWFQ